MKIIIKIIGTNLTQHGTVARRRTPVRTRQTLPAPRREPTCVGAGCRALNCMATINSVRSRLSRVALAAGSCGAVCASTLQRPPTTGCKSSGRERRATTIHHAHYLMMQAPSRAEGGWARASSDHLHHSVPSGTCGVCAGQAGRSGAMQAASPSGFSPNRQEHQNRAR